MWTKIFLVTVISVNVAAASKQFVGVRGQVICENRPYKGAKVKLFDDDKGLDTDDLLAEGWSGVDGSFSISGSENEFTTIDPKVNFYHDCNDLLPCQRKFTIFIPKDYVTEEGEPIKFFDVGVLNLDGEYPEEGRDCVH
ncbi:unnamed protein product [Bursaphelenchus xylophilus]|uniref:(pine wood nematode) hypothetical protein n=1 Tax=Bursaphelenchus xylophilus TaxID=6326 RepID=A0A1I7S602_BURXY|nr:unnamed protein product [Bursaphelenchus xylophilus]CAG9082442.1 unnamed protein product [Bursaphelenchus xylophilus]